MATASASLSTVGKSYGPRAAGGLELFDMMLARPGNSWPAGDDAFASCASARKRHEFFGCRRMNISRPCAGWADPDTQTGAGSAYGRLGVIYRPSIGRRRREASASFGAARKRRQLLSLFNSPSAMCLGKNRSPNGGGGGGRRHGFQARRPCSLNA